MLAELILWAVLTGKDSWFLHRSASDPNRRMQELMYESDHSGMIQPYVEPSWFSDQPSHLTPDRTHGGVR